MAKRKATNKIIVHCSATPATMDIGAAEIRQWHLERGWKDIGYHFVIRRNGLIETGRRLEDIGAHVAGQNEDSIGICLVGGVEPGKGYAANYTDDQWLSLKVLINSILEKYEGLDVTGHNDWTNAKACPCFNVKQWWASETHREDALVDASTVIYQKMIKYPEHSEVYKTLRDVLNEIGGLK